MASPVPQPPLPGFEGAAPATLNAALTDLVGPLVVNLSRRGARCDLYVGRTFAGRQDLGWGNPLRLGADTPARRRQILVDYFDWLQGPHPAAAALRGRVRSGELSGRTLGCWCAPKLCHGHVLAAVSNGAVEELRSFVSELRHLSS